MEQTQTGGYNGKYTIVKDLEELCAVAPAQSLLTFEDDTPRMSHVGNNETLLYQLDGVLRDMSW